MASEHPVATLHGVVAAADLTGSQYLCISLDASGKAAVSGAGARVDAVLQNKPDLDQAASLWSAGSTSKVVSGAALTAGDQLASDASGKAVVAGGGDFIIGVCTEGTAGADELASVALTMPGKA